jgi:hypothetical protein
MRSVPHERKLGGVHQRGMACSETKVCSYFITVFNTDRFHVCSFILLFAHFRGTLKIAEVTSRFEDINEFVDLVTSMGFKLESKVNLTLRLI